MNDHGHPSTCFPYFFIPFFVLSRVGSRVLASPYGKTTNNMAAAVSGGTTLCWIIYSLVPLI